MKNIIVVFTLVMFFFSCNNTKKDMAYMSIKTLETESTHPGKKLMEINCYACHNPTASHDDRLGPPMIAVKKHYLKEGMTKQEFIVGIQNWIKNPTEDTAKMHGAVRRFGIMPKQVFSKETIEQISDYIYDNDIDQPEWFEGHFNSEKGKHKGMGKGKGMQKKQTQSEVKDLSYEERGVQYALSTKAVLGKKLIGTLQKKGAVAALEFCNTSAYPLTDSMAIVNNANIKRVTDKPRNHNNLANSYELNQIEMFKKQLDSNSEIEPIVTEIDDKVHVYYPIITNDMCLQCHGKPNETIKKETLNKLEQLYPNDKAIGYNINEIRGIWSISFKK